MLDRGIDALQKLGLTDKIHYKVASVYNCRVMVKNISSSCVCGR